MIDNYVQYGTEWEKEMSKFPKQQLIKMLGKSYQSAKSLPIPSPGDNQSLEDAAQNLLNKMKYSGNWTSEQMFQMFLAGAAYVKAGEGLVDELRKANPWPQSGDFQRHMGWKHCCDKLQELLNQSK